MSHARLYCTLVLLFGLFQAPQALAASELQQLRAENAQLKAQLQALQQSCPAAAAAAPAQAAVAAPVAAPLAPLPVAPAAAPAAQAVVAAPAAPAAPVDAPQAPAAMVATPQAPPSSVAPAAAATPPPQAPLGYKLVWIDPVVQAADDENCQSDVFANTKDAPWKHEETWRGLRRQMKPQEVENLLGRHHIDVAKGGRTMWQYGKCGNSAAKAFVVLDNDGVLFWQQPDF